VHKRSPSYCSWTSLLPQHPRYLPPPLSINNFLPCRHPSCSMAEPIPPNETPIAKRDRLAREAARSATQNRLEQERRARQHEIESQYRPYSGYRSPAPPESSPISLRQTTPPDPSPHRTAMQNSGSNNSLTAGLGRSGSSNSMPASGSGSKNSSPKPQPAVPSGSQSNSPRLPAAVPVHVKEHPCRPAYQTITSCEKLIP
jgi:hypothetical protein